MLFENFKTFKIICNKSTLDANFSKKKLSPSLNKYTMSYIIVLKIQKF